MRASLNYVLIFIYKQLFATNIYREDQSHRNHAFRRNTQRLTHKMLSLITTDDVMTSTGDTHTRTWVLAATLLYVEISQLGSFSCSFVITVGSLKAGRPLSFKVFRFLQDKKYPTLLTYLLKTYISIHKLLAHTITSRIIEAIFCK